MQWMLVWYMQLTDFVLISGSGIRHIFQSARQSARLATACNCCSLYKHCKQLQAQALADFHTLMYMLPVQYVTKPQDLACDFYTVIFVYTVVLF